MNTILGVILLIANGQIAGAKTVAAYPNSSACQQAVHEQIKAEIEKLGPPPEGASLASMCVDLTDDLKAAPHVKT